MPTLLEELVADLNKNVFYREFSYSKNVFVPSAAETEIEFADHVVWVDDLLVIYQLKERDPGGDQSEDSERKWFRKKVLNSATKQVRDTLQFLEEHPRIEITNQRGHTLNVNSGSIRHIVKLVLYKPSASLPVDCLTTKSHLSRTAGLIHIVAWDDYQGLCGTLITPAEVAEYFHFRERLLTKHSAADITSERALVGQFLMGDSDATPDEQNSLLVSRLITDLEAFDISFLLDGVADRIEHQEGTGSDVDYYGIIVEFAKLTRLELKEVKTRFTLCIDAVKANWLTAPMRMITAGSRCGFAFIPTERENVPRRLTGLKNLSHIAKYEQRLNRLVGMSIAKEGTDFLIDWCLLDFPWKRDDVLEAAVRDRNPFRPLRSVVRPRYHIRT